MTTVGSGRYSYEVHESWATLPTGWTFGPVSAVATDSQDRVYAFQRKDPPVVVFDRDGNYLRSWGSSAITDGGTVNQYAVVCICCSGRSSSPDPTFSLV